MPNIFTKTLWAVLGLLTAVALFVLALGICWFAGVGTQCVFMALVLLSLYGITAATTTTDGE